MNMEVQANGNLQCRTRRFNVLLKNIILFITITQYTKTVVGILCTKTHLILRQEYITWYNNAIVCRTIIDRGRDKFHLSDLLWLYE
jgi:hypothetical protein